MKCWTELTVGERAVLGALKRTTQTLPAIARRAGVMAIPRDWYCEWEERQELVTTIQKAERRVERALRGLAHHGLAYHHPRMPYRHRDRWSLSYRGEQALEKGQGGG
jgi:hypothetical protein